MDSIIAVSDSRHPRYGFSQPTGLALVQSAWGLVVTEPHSGIFIAGMKLFPPFYALPFLTDIGRQNSQSIAKIFQFSNWTQAGRIDCSGRTFVREEEIFLTHPWVEPEENVEPYTYMQAELDGVPVAYVTLTQTAILPPALQERATRLLAVWCQTIGILAHAGIFA